MTICAGEVRERRNSSRFQPPGPSRASGAERTECCTFGAFALRPRDRTLLADGNPVVVTPRAYDLLLAFVDQPHQLITKEELLDCAWPDLVVEENNLQVQVSSLRKILGKDAIETVAGHGYRFTWDVVWKQDAAEPLTERGEAARLSCMQARFFLDRLTPRDTVIAVGHLLRALETEPDNVEAWVILAHAYANQAGKGWAALDDAVPKARAAARRAVALDPYHPGAHAVLGRVQLSFDWDWRGGDASYRRAVQCSPNDATYLMAMASCTGSLGNLKEAVGLVQRALVSLPLSQAAHRIFGYLSLCDNRLDEAERAFDTVLELNPVAGLVWCWLGTVELLRGRPAHALAHFQKETVEWFRLVGIATANNALGNDADSDRALQSLIEKYSNGGALNIAWVHAFRHEYDSAFHWLDVAKASRDPGLADVRIDVFLRNLHADRRWAPFVQSMHLAV